MIMDYIPGHLHEKLQNEFFFLISNDFAWTNCGPRRLNEISDLKDWDDYLFMKSVVKSIKCSGTLVMNVGRSLKMAERFGDCADIY